MRNLKMFLIAALISLTACRSEYDGMILIDENTGKKYLLQYHGGDIYLVKERVMIINSKDTTYQFK